MALWSGRFEEATNEYALKWGASLETDKVMAEHDIAGSIAHARMLSEQGIISEQDFDDIEAGLGRIRTQIREGTFAWDERDEDVHMAVERMGMSMRAYGRVLKVARTIADLRGAQDIATEDVAEAIQYRELDGKYWK